ncbi:MAG: FAD-binding protein [Acidimicrobiales bacterium]
MTSYERRLLSGWGRNPSSLADVVRPTALEGVEPVIAEALRSGRQVIGRGLGRSYGDAAQSAGGLVVDLTACDRILEFDLAAGVLRAEAGLGIDALLRWSVPRGFFVPVTPGTRQVTIGGAIAADVHGKNHHCDGSFGRFVRSLRLATPSGERFVSPEADPEIFWATVGGMGLTGVILEATIELMAIETALMAVDTVRTRDLEECMTLMSEGDSDYRYSVAWVDCLRRGRALGRGVLSRANHVSRTDAAALAGSDDADLLTFAPHQVLRVPVSAPLRLATRTTARLFNEAWYRSAPPRRSGEMKAISAYFHPLDGVGSWNMLYGRTGFTQYQFVVPLGSGDVVRRVIEQLNENGLPSLLAVLKRFGPGDPAPLSFPCEGWTLALDLPLGIAGLGKVLDGLDDLVAAAGGRVYLAKDARLRPELLRQMYPRLADWEAVRDELDPDHVMSSDLGRRLHLAEKLVG